MAAASESKDNINVVMNQERFVGLLGKLIGETQWLQNQPPALIPQEDRAVNHVLECLKPYLATNGGRIQHKHIAYHEGRGNLILTLPGTGPDVVSFVGSHFDVVPATQEGWRKNPFELSIDGDELYGRGTTDCLGHVAMLTDFFCELAQRPPLKITVVAVFIASEENNSIPGVGIEALQEHGELEICKKGPVYWVDVADTQPCLGTAGVTSWKLTIKGKNFHSGIPSKGINAIELGMEATRYMQDRFYEDFPRTQKEEEYNYVVSSSLKPTKCHSGLALNIIPGECVIEGDIRLTPFYNFDDVIAKVKSYIDTLDVSTLPTHGQYSKYTLPAEDRKGEISIEIAADYHEGIACNLKSEGYTALHNSVGEVTGAVKPYSITGSLPLVRDLQKAGLDIQLTGYGRMSCYHGNDEFCSLKEMADGTKIISGITSRMEEKARA